MAMNKYSVLLSYPDGADTYFTWVEADTPEDAAREARGQAVETNTYENDDTVYYTQEDFTLLAVFAGHIEMELGIWDGVNL